MKNTYFTVDIQSAGTCTPCNNTYMKMCRYAGRNMIFLLLVYDPGNNMGSSGTGKYIIDSFGKCIDSVLCSNGYNPECNAAINQKTCNRTVRGRLGIGLFGNRLKEMLYICNSHIAGQNHNRMITGVSLGIIAIAGSRYIVLQSGDSVLYRCINGHVKTYSSDTESSLGIQPRFDIRTIRGMIGYGDVLVMCVPGGADNITSWYAGTILKKRYRYARIHGRGISAGNINDHIMGSFHDGRDMSRVSAVICCERAVM